MTRFVMFLMIATITLPAGCNNGPSSLTAPDDQEHAYGLRTDPAGSKGGPPQGIAFVSTRDFDALPNAGEIYTMNHDGTNPRRVTTNNVEDRQPNLSPNGKRIVFSRGQPNSTEQEIYVMNADGSGEVRLTNNEANDQTPAFSPSGKEIVFRSNRDGNPELYVMNSGGSNVRRLTESENADLFPTWSPNGKQIAFSRDGDIYVMNAEGTGVTQLTSHPSFEYKPTWSPNSTRIAFAVSHGGLNSEIWSMNADGSDVRNLTPKPPGAQENEWDNRWPVWSTNGRHIYFQAVRPDSMTDPDPGPHALRFEIFRMDADGGNPINLTQLPGVDVTPDIR